MSDDELSVKLSEMFYMALGDMAESEQIQDLIKVLGEFINERERNS